MNLYKIFGLSFWCFMVIGRCEGTEHSTDTFFFSFERYGKKSYLLGTSHGINPLLLPETVRDCVLGQSVLVVENTDFQKPLDKDSYVAMGVLKRSDEPSYIEILGADDSTELLKYVNPFLLKKGGHVDANLLNLKGLYAAYIQGHFLEGMDYWLTGSFKKDHKIIHGLETRENVAAFFEDLEFDNFKQIIKHKAGFESLEAVKIEEDYLSGIIPSEEETSEDEMLIRNTDWLSKIINYHIQTEKLVVAVGYCHLFGKNGLLNLLSNEGFTFERMDKLGNFSWIRRETYLNLITDFLLKPLFIFSFGGGKVFHKKKSAIIFF